MPLDAAIGHNGGPPLADPSFNVPQWEFINLDKKFKAFVAGFGSGKTWIGCGELCNHAWAFPKINAGYFGPTYTHIKDIFWPTIEEVAPDWGLRAEIMKSDKIVKLWEDYRDESGKKRSRLRCKIYCRSMDKPSTIVGFKIGHAVVDEIDIMPKKKAQDAWRKIIARMRYKKEGLKNGISVTTTPEGFNFVYDQFVKQLLDKPSLKELYGLIQASTYDNEGNLPPDYIQSLQESYPPQLIDAYLEGKFVNLASGTVYASFDRKLNHSDAEIREGEILHIGMDFNVLNMSAIVHVIRDGEPIAVNEIVKARDTPEICRIIRERWGRDAEEKHQINIYPDASGQNTSSKSASVSDLTILRENGFNVMANTQNPRIKDRVLSMNGMFLNAKGQRRYKVNTNNCPTYTASLEQQAYDDNGEPDKKSGTDHTNDAGGYFISYKFAVVKKVLVQNRPLGV